MCVVGDNKKSTHTEDEEALAPQGEEAQSRELGGEDVTADQGQEGLEQGEATMQSEHFVQDEEGNIVQPLPAACVAAPIEDSAQLLQQQQQQEQQQGLQQSRDKVLSSVVMKNSEVRGGTVTSISVFGSGSSFNAEGCIIGGSNFACQAAKNARVELVGCEGSGTIAAAVVTGRQKGVSTFLCL